MTKALARTISKYNALQSASDKKICALLKRQIDAELKHTESKIWHGSPVWFIDGNPVVGYHKLKSGVRLLFWSGADFDEPMLKPGSGKFKDASILYTDASEINSSDLRRWLKKSCAIQWDYKNIVKRRGKLILL